MHHAVISIGNRLSLRQPQRDSLEILARVCEIAPIKKGTDPTEALKLLQAEFPQVAYLPGREVVGLSKIPRLVECFARRLQLQETLTHQVAESLMKHLRVKGAACVIEAQHSCMSCRGVKKKASMVTSSMLGKFRGNSALRMELLALVK